ncbi:DUF2812 domain-containing protein [Bacillus pseudomycoides]|uniref:DUF2812 domain-containing protein n=2 Tax=Bacillaceae TaxID=186817 RepID=UPI000BECF4FD|nr:DUF2812 domain-containing protein [Bacillus pseudomycoides]MED4653252.1 DUF2812 domain-containing protein [Bacillus pseudomycoides]PEE06816.1 hypothetical protein CON86_06210 [Bacillus pseudomycoides]PEM73380.1 hypothetical protein CN632_19990 [Bacillus pseudomycoides]PHC90660.1 hypothetical protein COF63_01400 [Bacillus pseudomycoides]
MKKFRLFTNVLNEQFWLNDMLAQGYTCTSVNPFGVYTFKKTNIKKVMRLDYQDYMSKEKYGEYVAIHEDFGWEHVYGSRFGSMHYWQKEEDGRDEMFSDQTSRVAFYKRLSNYSFTCAMMSFMYTIVLFNGPSFIRLFNPKVSYLTEGLWEKEGTAFWSTFLFETPFAMLRFLSPWIFIIAFLFFLYSYSQYNKKKKELT